MGLWRPQTTIRVVCDLTISAICGHFLSKVTTKHNRQCRCGDGAGAYYVWWGWAQAMVLCGTRVFVWGIGGVPPAGFRLRGPRWNHGLCPGVSFLTQGCRFGPLAKSLCLGVLNKVSVLYYAILFKEFSGIELCLCWKGKETRPDSYY